MATALVTGGTSGIGAEFARQLAARGSDLVLVARDESRLAAVAEELHAEYGISVETLRADLSDRGDVQVVADRLSEAERPIDMLVNNAGGGVRSPLTAGEAAPHERALDTMARAVMLLSVAAVRPMVERGRGAIVNVSSIQGYLTTGSYAAVKSFVTTFTESLAVELAGTGVRATALLPGWVRTEWHERAGARSSSLPAWLWTDPDVVVRAALRDSDRGRVLSMPTVRYRVLGWFARNLPARTVRWVSARLSAHRRDRAAGAVGSESRVTAGDGER